MPFMFVTEATFQFAMLSLKVGWLLNSEAMLVTAAVFQLTMLPYVVASPPVHAVTAAAMLPLLMAVCACMPRGRMR
jgi:hypothetical protein